MAEEIIPLSCSLALAYLPPVAFTLPNTLRAANDVGFCMIVSVVSMWIFRIGAEPFVFEQKNFGMGVLGVWVSDDNRLGCDELFSSLLRYRGTKWQKAKGREFL